MANPENFSDYETSRVHAQFWQSVHIMNPKKFHTVNIGIIYQTSNMSSITYPGRGVISQGERTIYHAVFRVFFLRQHPRDGASRPLGAFHAGVGPPDRLPGANIPACLPWLVNICRYYLSINFSQNRRGDCPEFHDIPLAPLFRIAASLSLKPPNGVGKLAKARLLYPKGRIRPGGPVPAPGVPPNGAWTYWAAAQPAGQNGVAVVPPAVPRRINAPRPACSHMQTPCNLW